MDDLHKWLTGILGAAVVWLFKTTITTDKKADGHDRELQGLREEVKSLRDGRLTLESVRAVVKEALTDFERRLSEQREGQSHTLQLEMQTFFSKEIEKMLPRIIREIKGNSAVLGRTVPWPEGPEVPR